MFNAGFMILLSAWGPVVTVKLAFTLVCRLEVSAN